MSFSATQNHHSKVRTAGKDDYLYLNVTDPRKYQLDGAWSLKKIFFNRHNEEIIITSSSSLPSRKVGGIPGCLATNNSIKLWVAWSLYKHTKAVIMTVDAVDSKERTYY